MKLTDLWATKDKPTLSFELFPARSEKAAANLERAIDALAALRPDFVSVTFGAGGSTREGSYQLVKSLIQDRGLDVITYFACYGLSPEQVTSVLDDYQALISIHLPSAIKIQDDSIATIKTKGLIGEKYVEITPGGSEDILKPGQKIRDTQPPVDLEQLISSYVFGKL